MAEINWQDFTKVELRVGRIVEARDFPEAHRPAYLLWVDFGPERGVLKSSAQLCVRYEISDLIGKLVVGVTNFPAKQIGPIMSECLVTGFDDGEGGVVLCTPDAELPLGTRLA